MKHLFSFTIFITLLLVSAQFVFAQNNLNASNLSNVRATDVTDAQLQTFLSQSQSQGISIDQAFQLAQTRGLRQSEIPELRQRINQLRMTQSSIGIEDENRAFGMGMQRPERIETEMMRRTFGSSVFQSQISELVPRQNVPTPTSYTLGAGDELLITIWGDQTSTYRLDITPEGAVIIDNLGPVMVSGLTLTEAEKLIRENLRILFVGMRGSEGDQTTFARISINRLRSIQVAITGEVVNPGNYAITSGSTVYNALYRAGGPGERGSYRRIRVVRENEIIAETDLYEFLVEGIQRSNIHLRDGDIVHVLPYENRVEVIGEARRGGLLFETIEGEKLSDLIHYAGGFSERAFRRHIRIHRNTPVERRIITVNHSQIEEVEIQNGDVVFIEELLSRFENRVTIQGAVWRSGDFELKHDMTLHDLITEAGGMRPDAFRSRGLINRMQDDLTLQQISFDISGLLEDSDRHNVKLQPEDQVWIRSIHNIADEQTVEINGAVRQGGRFPYRDNMNLEDLVLRANGFSNAASESRIEISRRVSGDSTIELTNTIAEVFSFSVDRNLRLNDDDARFILKPYDQVQVYRRPDYREQITVTIEGEILYPGTYTISSRNERVSDIVRRAGGVTSEAYLPGARLTRKMSSFDRAEIDLDIPDVQNIIGANDSNQNNLIEAENDTIPRARTQETELDERTTIEERSFLNRINRIGEEDVDQLPTDEQIRRIGLDLEQILRRPGTRDDLFIRDGDVIRIPEELQTVAILGAVMQDVEVRYSDGQNFRYYVDRAGGFSENARRNRAYVVYANGDVDRSRKYIFGLIRSNPEIMPGAQIIVPEKLPGDGLSTAEVISLTSSAATTALLLLTLIDRLGN